MNGFVLKLDLCTTVSCLAPYCCNESCLEDLRHSFRIDIQAHVDSVFSLTISYTVVLMVADFSMEVNPCH